MQDHNWGTICIQDNKEPLHMISLFLNSEKWKKKYDRTEQVRKMRYSGRQTQRESQKQVEAFYLWCM